MDIQKINKEKYENAILYFVQHCNNKFLGATKLNKLVYYLDFLNYREREVSVTGDDYYNRQFGPVPDSINAVLNDLMQDDKIIIKNESYGGISFKTKTKPNMSVFSKEEQELLNDICKEFKNYDTEKIVAQTHLEAPWFYSKPGQKINYEYAHSIETFSNDED